MLAETFEELEVTREELAVADEEISSSEARFEEAVRTLEASVRHYRELFDGAPDAYAVTDGAGMIREGNRALSADLGIHKAFLERKPLVNFVARGDVREYRDFLGALVGGKSDGGRIALHFRPRNGAPVFLAEITTSIVSSPEHRVLFIRWALRKARAPEGGPGPGEHEEAEEEGERS